MPGSLVLVRLPPGVGGTAGAAGGAAGTRDVAVAGPPVLDRVLARVGGRLPRWWLAWWRW